MDTKIFRVTPAIAREWLKRNTDNRPLRRGFVDALKAAFTRGEYVLTHQGIAFAQDGALLDGQHRLTAIAEMPAEWHCEMNVSRGLSEAAFQCIDIGAKRSSSDILDISIGLAAVARFCATMIDTQRAAGITPQYLVPFVHGVLEPYERLTEFCAASSKVWSSSAVRSAAILRMLSGGDERYIFTAYRALNLCNYEAMCPIIQSLHKQNTNGSARHNTTELFVRTYRAFDVKSAQVARLQIKSQADTLVEVRGIINREVLGIKKAPAPRVAVKPKASPSNGVAWVAQ